MRYRKNQGPYSILRQIANLPQRKYFDLTNCILIEKRESREEEPEDA
jgi:hypothetical protein